MVIVSSAFSVFSTSLKHHPMKWGCDLNRKNFHPLKALEKHHKLGRLDKWCHLGILQSKDIIPINLDSMRKFERRFKPSSHSKLRISPSLSFAGCKLLFLLKWKVIWTCPIWLFDHLTIAAVVWWLGKLDAEFASISFEIERAKVD